MYINAHGCSLRGGVLGEDIARKKKKTIEKCIYSGGFIKELQLGTPSCTCTWTYLKQKFITNKTYNVQWRGKAKPEV